MGSVVAALSTLHGSRVSRGKQSQQHQALERNEDGLSHNADEVTRVVT
jgi:hypothetical protein